MEGQKGLVRSCGRGFLQKGYFQECQSLSFWLQIEEGLLTPRGNVWRVGSAEFPPHPTVQPAWVVGLELVPCTALCYIPCGQVTVPARLPKDKSSAGFQLGQGAAEGTPASGQWQTPPCCHVGSGL